ncbi:hypothetical protein HG535_0H04020 [Zygotorulaspora mrakii]|uniref:Probable endonuclease LCL3 n=1 Tax=Zygotorulaspora mrakii TaxID=42260 RepID=A0A7H9B8Q6_ZYGMR|nr:uncharacterized protein HG535_0H04020 [Zygotorulaspora mrakii]QLG75075.1 hypothetical protein HG535_0H04020 [Zygotorulaspora mrakii]
MSDSKNLSTSRSLVYPADVVFLSLCFTGSFVGAYSAFNRYLKRYSKVTSIPSSAFRKRWLFGKVTSVGDGDNFHFFHTPGGIFGGWGWLRKLPKLSRVEVKEVGQKTHKPSAERAPLYKRLFHLIFEKNKSQTAWSNYYLSLHVPYKNRRNLSTISVRICGVDAPERAHFGNTAQPFSEEALNWLRYTLLGRNVWIKPLSVDQYNRCVARVAYWTWKGWKNVSLEMIEEGLAVVYESKTSAEFDGQERLYRRYETIAKSQKRGIWTQKNFETPGEYKRRL